MAKKIAQVDIKLTGLKSISDLEQELQSVNQQLKLVDINSTEFTTLSNRAQQATAKLEVVNQSLKGVTAQDKTDAIKKMGEGLVGAFQVGAGASLLFGEKTGEELNKVIAKVAGVYSAVDGLDKMSKAFSSQNISRLKSVASQWGLVGNSSKIAGMAMRTALITSGIGLAIVAVGLLVANWDKLTSAIKRNRKEKELNDRVKQLTSELEYNEKILTEEEKQVETQKKLNIIHGEREKNNELDISFNKKKIGILQGQITLAKTELELATLKAKTDEDALQKALKGQSSMLKTAGKLLLNGAASAGMEAKKIIRLSEISTESENNLNILKAQLKTNEEVLSVLMEQTSELSSQALYKKQIDAIDARINYLKNQNDLYDAQGLKLDNIHKNNLEIVELEKEKLEWNVLNNNEQTQGDINAKQNLDNQKKVLNEIYEKHKLNTTEEIRQLEISRQYAKELGDITNGKDSKRREQDSSETSYQKSIDYQQHLFSLEERRLALQDYITEQQIKMHPFDKKGLEMLKERLGLRSDELKLGGEFQNISINMDKLSLRLQLTYANQLRQLNLIADAKKNLINMDIDSVEQSIKAYADIQAQTEHVQLLANEEVKRLTKEREALSVKLDGVKTEEEKLDILKKISVVENDIAKYRQDSAAATSESHELYIKGIELSAEKERLEYEIAGVIADVVATQKEITYEIEQQVRLSSRLNEFISQYANEIQAAQELSNALFEFAATKQDELAKQAEKRIKKAEKTLDNLNKKQEKSAEKLKDLQDELKDADGERYDELLSLIASEQLAETDGVKAIADAKRLANNELLKAEYEKEMAEYNAAKIRKKQAVIDSAISGALAVIKALPNIVLAALVGIANGVAIATITKQSGPEKPTTPKYLASGGLLVGRSHAEGGIPIGNTGIEVEGREFVINKSATANYLPLLEAINATGRNRFAAGGQLPGINTNSTRELIDYDRLASAVLSGIQPKVAVVDIVTGINKVRVIQQNAVL